MLPDLHALGEGLFKGLVVCQHSDAHHQHHQHDSQLEVGVQGCCKHLGCCQSQRLQQHYAVPEPEPVPAATSHWVKVCKHLLMPTFAVAATLCCVSPRLVRVPAVTSAGHMVLAAEIAEHADPVACQPHLYNTETAGLRTGEHKQISKQTDRRQHADRSQSAVIH